VNGFGPLEAKREDISSPLILVCYREKNKRAIVAISATPKPQTPTEVRSLVARPDD